MDYEELTVVEEQNQPVSGWEINSKCLARMPPWNIWPSKTKMATSAGEVTRLFLFWLSLGHVPMCSWCSILAYKVSILGFQYLHWYIWFEKDLLKVCWKFCICCEINAKLVMRMFFTVVVVFVHKILILLFFPSVTQVV